MYHGITDGALPSSTVGTHDPVYTISRTAFAAQIAYLRKGGFTVQSLQRHLSDPDPQRQRTVMTFDDGNKSDIAVALPRLQENGFTATFYITTDWIGRPGFMSKEDIRHLHESGMEIGSHGHTHRYFDELSVDELTEELARSVSVLSAITGRAVTALGAPGGRLHPGLTSIATGLGIETIATSRLAMYGLGADPMAVPRVPVQRSTTMDEFQRINGGESVYYRKKMLRHAILSYAKRLFGNGRYEALRSKFLSRSPHH
jgi:peptidoglycan/xylan/chitin deacetylase (PgdA/CDA1 family)